MVQSPHLQTYSLYLAGRKRQNVTTWGWSPQVSFIVYILPFSVHSVFYHPHKAPTACHSWRLDDGLLHLKSVWCCPHMLLSLENHQDVTDFDPAEVSQIAGPVDGPMIIWGGLQSHYCLDVLSHQSNLMHASRSKQASLDAFWIESHDRW